MATQRRAATLARRHLQSLLIPPPPPPLIASSKTLALPLPLRSHHLSILRNPNPNCFISLDLHCHFSSRTSGSSGDGEDEDEDDDEGEEEEDDDGDDEDESCNGSVKRSRVSGKSEEDKVMEAEEIGYKVIGALDPSERPFKPWEPFFAIVQIGSHQFKVSNGDAIFTERLKFCEVSDKLVLNKVLMLGSKTRTVFGRPILPDAAVHAVVEEHALDAKVIIFKKKRRKNYRRTKGHRQELTKLRITDIQGIGKSEDVAVAA